MNCDEIKQMIESAFQDAQVHVEGDGRHFQVTVISDAFLGKSSLQKQQMVYQSLGDHIRNGSIHALTMKTLTLQEWENQK